MNDQDTQRKIINRLKRAQGQLNALIAAVESGADCRATVTQLSAVTSALDRAGFAIISSAMRECLAAAEDDTERTDDRESLTIEQLEKLFMSLA